MIEYPRPQHRNKQHNPKRNINSLKTIKLRSGNEMLFQWHRRENKSVVELK